jgi:hypothetical protein
LKASQSWLPGDPDGNQQHSGAHYKNGDCRKTIKFIRNRGLLVSQADGTRIPEFLLLNPAGTSSYEISIRKLDPQRPVRDSKGVELPEDAYEVRRKIPGEDDSDTIKTLLKLETAKYRVAIQQPSVETDGLP